MEWPKDSHLYINFASGIWLAGKVGSSDYSLSFDGVDDYVDLSPIDLSSSDQMTLMCWINPDDLTSESENTIIRQDWGEPNWLLSFSLLQSFGHYLTRLVPHGSYKPKISTEIG